MRPVRITKTLAVASVNNIAQSQTPGASASFTLNGSAVTGGVAVLDTSRQILFTFAANESGHNYVITGNQRIDGTGNTITETVAGTASTATSVQMFGQVSKIVSVSASSGNIQVGTNTVGTTDWVLVDNYLDPTQLTVASVVTGTVTYSIQYTYDDILGAYDPQGGAWSNANLANLNIFTSAQVSGATGNTEATFNDPITAWRLQITSGTGSVLVTGIQAGVGGLGS